MGDFSKSSDSGKSFESNSHFHPQPINFLCHHAVKLIIFREFYTPLLKSQGSVTRDFSSKLLETAPTGALVERGTQWTQ
jgi:hypothetical protein